MDRSGSIRRLSRDIEAKGALEQIMETSDSKDRITRRGIIQAGSAIIAAAGALTAARAQDSPGSDPQKAAAVRSPDHRLPNESDPGPKNTALEAQNPDSVWSPPTDNGTVKPFKYSFALARKRVESGGWTRQVTARELPISTTIAGVEMRLTAGGVRELHWHV
jgi:oxalate decarboxylase